VSRRRLTSEEARLWRRVTARDKPLRPIADEPDLDDASRPETKNALKSAPAKAVPANVAPLKPEKPKSPRAHDFGAEKRVRRGQIEVEARIDLHGFTQIAAESALETFLLGAQRARKRAVLVITGRGSLEPSWPHSQRGVLRRRLPEWLDALAREGVVSGYASAHRAHGGDGAFYVFLKQRR
jgi:DNA-nicking Smr family endonuclease